MGSIYKRGTVYWIAWVDRRGKQHCESTRLKGVRTGTNHNEAKRVLAEREGKIAEGVPITKDSSKYTFADAAQLVIDNYIRKERRSIGDMQRRLGQAPATDAGHVPNDRDHHRPDRRVRGCKEDGWSQQR